MTLVPIILDVVLGALLVGALLLGMRLDKRLKGLRDSHAGFAQAVADLDRAAMRAEQGLADLRAATDEAAEVLAARIEKAKTLSMKLDTQIDRAAAAPPSAVAVTAPARESFLREAARRPDRHAAPARESFRPIDGVTTRSRARVDEELFDEQDGPKLRAAMGGGR